MSAIDITRASRRRLGAAAALGCVLCAGALSALAPSPAAAEGPAATASATTAAHPYYGASVELCHTADTDSERAVTIVGEANAIPGSTRMEVRVNLLEHMAIEPGFRSVTAPGLGQWSRSAKSATTFKYIQEFKNLAAPASYRGEVHIRWLNGRGRVMRTVDVLTTVCHQPLKPRHQTEAEAENAVVAGA